VSHDIRAAGGCSRRFGRGRHGHFFKILPGKSRRPTRSLYVVGSVPIPPHEPVGTLPPFVGDPHAASGRAPYPTLPEEFVDRFGHTSRRRQILRGLFEYRALLRTAGIQIAYQWIDGSFVDRMADDPRDVDLVSFYVVPAGYTTATFAQHMLDNFPDALNGRARFHVDGYFVELNAAPIELVRQAHYWSGLFAHQRTTFRWRGVISMVLHVDDADALAKLSGP
jgi:hypothetical protein